MKKLAAIFLAVSMAFSGISAFGAKGETDVNVAFGKKAVSSVYGTGGYLTNVVGNVTDGTYSNMFISTINNTQEELVTIDLGAKYPLTEVRLVSWAKRAETVYGGTDYSFGDAVLEITTSNEWSGKQTDKLTNAVTFTSEDEFVQIGTNLYGLSFDQSDSTQEYRYVQFRYIPEAGAQAIRLLELEVYSTLEAAEKNNFTLGTSFADFQSCENEYLSQDDKKLNLDLNCNGSTTFGVPSKAADTDSSTWYIFADGRTNDVIWSSPDGLPLDVSGIALYMNSNGRSFLCISYYRIYVTDMQGEKHIVYDMSDNSSNWQYAVNIPMPESIGKIKEIGIDQYTCDEAGIATTDDTAMLFVEIGIYGNQSKLVSGGKSVECLSPNGLYMGDSYPVTNLVDGNFNTTTFMFAPKNQTKPCYYLLDLGVQMSLSDVMLASRYYSEVGECTNLQVRATNSPTASFEDMTLLGKVEDTFPSSATKQERWISANRADGVGRNLGEYRYIAVGNVQADRADSAVLFGLSEIRVYGNEVEGAGVNFELLGADGYRMPYTIREGLEANAALTLTKTGDINGEYLMAIAQYDENNSLVAVDMETVDMTDVEEMGRKSVEAGITIKGNAGKVKGFLFDKTTIKPIAETLVCDEQNIFPDDILDTKVEYSFATEHGYDEYGYSDEYGKIDAIFYDGSMLNGKQTKVFAYIGIPTGASEENPVPAVVCVHGGGGKAYIDWVKDWNKQGYAAIAMDMYGCGPDGKKHEWAGMQPWENTAFLADFENAGMYHAVIDVINAHSLIRNFKEVDSSKTGIVGCSWGGTTTTIVSGVDNRFSFAAPVFGSGYLDESRNYFSERITQEQHSLHWDPANFAAKAKMPVMFINGDMDQHFSVNTTSLTYGVTPNAYIGIYHNLAHSDYTTRTLPQTYSFAESVFEGKINLIKVSDVKVENGNFTANYELPEGTTVESVETYYITDEQIPLNGALEWKKVTENTMSNGKLTVALPDNATYCYASIKDNNGNINSTKLVEIK